MALGRCVTCLLITAESDIVAYCVLLLFSPSLPIFFFDLFFDSLPSFPPSLPLSVSLAVFHSLFSVVLVTEPSASVLSYILRPLQFIF